MKNTSSKFLNSILALGMFLVFVGFLLVIAFAGTRPNFAVWSIPVVVFLAGLVDLYFYIAFVRQSFKLFLGLNLSLYGIFSLFIAFDLFPAGISQLWPVLMLISALSLFIAGRTTGKKFALGYDFPALALFVLGIIFLLFSFEVINISFSSLTLLLFPFVVMGAGLFLILLFFHRKSILEILPEDVIKELNEEDNLSDTEED